MNRCKYVSLLFCFSLFRSAVAQTDQNQVVPPPQAPFVRVPDRAAWEVNIKYSDDAPSPAAGASGGGAAPVAVPKGGGRINRIESVKVDNVKRDLFTYSDGREAEVWYYGVYPLVKGIDGNSAQALNPHPSRIGGVNLGLFLSGTFPGVEWIQAGDYKSAAKQGQEPCYYFERDASPGQPKAEAWIDLATGLPVKIQLGSMTYQFRMREEPSAVLRMPEPYAACAERLKKLGQ